MSTPPGSLSPTKGTASCYRKVEWSYPCADWKLEKTEKVTQNKYPISNQTYLYWRNHSRCLYIMKFQHSILTFWELPKTITRVHGIFSKISNTRSCVHISTFRHYSDAPKIKKFGKSENKLQQKIYTCPVLKIMIFIISIICFKCSLPILDGSKYFGRFSNWIFFFVI